MLDARSELCSCTLHWRVGLPDTEHALAWKKATRVPRNKSQAQGFPDKTQNVEVQRSAAVLPRPAPCDSAPYAAHQPTPYSATSPRRWKMVVVMAPPLTMQEKDPCMARCGSLVPSSSLSWT